MFAPLNPMRGQGWLKAVGFLSVIYRLRLDGGHVMDTYGWSRRRALND